MSEIITMSEHTANTTYVGNCKVLRDFYTDTVIRIVRINPQTGQEIPSPAPWNGPTASDLAPRVSAAQLAQEDMIAAMLVPSNAVEHLL